MAEHRIVVPGVVGSSPIIHPIFKRILSDQDALFLCSGRIFVCIGQVSNSFMPSAKRLYPG